MQTKTEIATSKTMPYTRQKAFMSVVVSVKDLLVLEPLRWGNHPFTTAG